MDRKELIIDSMINCCHAGFRLHEEDALQLLKNIVELWLTIRGLAISKSWMEDYKRATQDSTKKKSLRKELKIADQPKPTD